MIRTNTYNHTFVATCPSDGEKIIYSLKIKAQETIMVEHIKTATALIKKGMQEQIADDLFLRFGGEQKLTGTHQGVLIISRRTEKAKKEISPTLSSCYCDLVHTTCSHCKG
jgi:hypothetical protein